MPLFLPVVEVFMRKREGESRHPCRTPHLETFRQLAGVGSPAAHVLKSAPDEGDHLLGRSSSRGFHSVLVPSLILSLCLHR